MALSEVNRSSPEIKNPHQPTQQVEHKEFLV